MTLDKQPGPVGATRRRVVTTAGHLAWSTPVILAAAAAPAMAASGAAAIACGQPTTTRPNDEIRVSCIISNLGNVAPESMSVTVTLTPLVGTLQQRTPVSNDPSFLYVGRTIQPSGAHVLTFTKVDPQIAPSTSATMRFSFWTTADGTSTLRKGTIDVLPSVPAPGTAAGNANDYE